MEMDKQERINRNDAIRAAKNLNWLLNNADYDLHYLYAMQDHYGEEIRTQYEFKIQHKLEKNIQNTLLKKIQNVYRKACDEICYKIIISDLKSKGINLPQKTSFYVKELQSVLKMFSALKIPMNLEKYYGAGNSRVSRWRDKYGLISLDHIIKYYLKYSSVEELCEEFDDCGRYLDSDVKHDRISSIDVKIHPLYNELSSVRVGTLYGDKYQIAEAKALYDNILNTMKKSLYLKQKVEKNYYYIKGFLIPSFYLMNDLKNLCSKQIKIYESDINDDLKELKKLYAKRQKDMVKDQKSKQNESSTTYNVSQLPEIPQLNEIEEIYEELKEVNWKLSNRDTAYSLYINKLSSYDPKPTHKEFVHGLIHEQIYLQDKMINMLLRYPECNKSEYNIDLEQFVKSRTQGFYFQNEETQSAIAYYVYLEWTKYYASIKKKSEVAPFENYSLEKYGIELSVPKECVAQYKDLGFEVDDLDL